MSRKELSHRVDGFTLMECMFAAVLLAIIAVAVSGAVLSGQADSHDAQRTQQKVALAEAMQERVAALPYNDPDGGVSNPGPESGETSVSLFDNCDDFDGYIESPGQLKDAGGQLLPDSLQEFTVCVSVQSQVITIASLGGNIPGLNVTVTVTDRLGRTWELTRFLPADLPE